MTSFRNPARPRPGAFPFGGTLLFPEGARRATARVVIESPQSGRLSHPDAQVVFRAEATPAALEGTPDAAHWTVRIFAEARAEDHPHYWHSEEEPTRTVEAVLPPAAALSIPGEDSPGTLSAWEAHVALYDGDVLLAEATSLFVIETGLLSEPAVLLEGVHAAVATESVVPYAVPGLLLSDPARHLPAPLAGTEAIPALYLDVSPVG